MSVPNCIILDRDGTLIDVVRHTETGVISVAFHPSQLRLLPGVVQGLTRFRDAGFDLAIATNQPGPAKGQFSKEAAQRTNAALQALLKEQGFEVASFQVCWHHPEGGPGGDSSLVGACACRKPQPGMLHSILTELNTTPDRAWMVGDSPSDVQAAQAAGVHSAMVAPWNRCELCPLREGPNVRPDLMGTSLDAIAKEIVARG